MKKKISALIFDFGNVLIGLDFPGFTKNLEVLTGLRGDEDQRSFYEILAPYERGLISSEIFINRIIKLSRRPVQAREIILCWNSILVGIKPETLELLKALKPYFKTYILSNTSELHIEWVRNHLKKVHHVTSFEGTYLDKAFYSHELKMAKPERNIYLTVQKEIGVPAGEILFIDDLEENVSAARQAGWNGVVHRPDKNLIETLQDIIDLPKL